MLIKVDDKEPYDRFRGRLMIPIRDPRGRVIAFGGRVIGDGEPKYLNSPDTPLFDKGRTLYNLDKRRAGVAQVGPRDRGRRLYGRDRAGAGRVRRGGRAARHRADRGAARAAVAAGRRADPVLRRRCGGAEGRDPRGVARAARPRARPQPVVRDAARGAGPRRSRPRARARRRSRRCSPSPSRWSIACGRTNMPPSRSTRPNSARGSSAGSPIMPTRSPTATSATNISPSSAAASTTCSPRPRRDFTPAPRSSRARPGSKWTPPLPPATVQAKAVRAAGIDRVLAKAVLAGLIRHPAEIARHMEVLGGLKLAPTARSGGCSRRWSISRWRTGRLIAGAWSPYWALPDLVRLPPICFGPTPCHIRSRRTAPIRNAPAPTWTKRSRSWWRGRKWMRRWRMRRRNWSDDIRRGVRTANGTAQRATRFGRAACKSDPSEQRRGRIRD